MWNQCSLSSINIIRRIVLRWYTIAFWAVHYPCGRIECGSRLVQLRTLYTIFSVVAVLGSFRIFSDIIRHKWERTLMMMFVAILACSMFPPKYEPETPTDIPATRSLLPPCEAFFRHRSPCILTLTSRNHCPFYYKHIFPVLYPIYSEVLDRRRSCLWVTRNKVYL